MSTAGTAKLWDIRDGETSKQFEAFQEYLLLGPSRSLEATRHKLAKESPGYLRTLKLWASANDWVERARSYDAAVAAKQLGRREKLNLDDEIEKYRKATLEDASRLREIAREYFEIGVAAMQRLKESAELKPNEVGLILSRSTAMMQQSGDLVAVALGVSEIAAGLDVGSAGGGEGPPETGEGSETLPALAESEAAPE
jgi:hypothetical protein